MISRRVAFSYSTHDSFRLRCYLESSWKINVTHKKNFVVVFINKSDVYLFILGLWLLIDLFGGFQSCNFNLFTYLSVPISWMCFAGKSCWWCPRATGNGWGRSEPLEGWASSWHELWSRTPLHTKFKSRFVINTYSTICEGFIRHDWCTSIILGCFRGHI